MRGTRSINRTSGYSHLLGAAQHRRIASARREISRWAVVMVALAPLRVNVPDEHAAAYKTFFLASAKRFSASSAP